MSPRRVRLAVTLSSLALPWLAIVPLHAQGPEKEELPPAVLRRLGSDFFRHPNAGQAAYSPDGTILATGGMDIRLWDAKTRRLLRIMPLPDRPIDGDVTHLRFTADGKTLYCQGSGPGQVSAFDVASGKKLFRFIPESMDSGAFDVSPDGKIIAFGGQHGALTLWNAETLKLIRRVDGHKRAKPALGERIGDFYVQSVAFSPDGKLLASMALWDDAVRVFDAASGEQKCALPISPIFGTRLAFSPEGHLAGYQGAHPADPAKPGKITVWDVTTGRLHKEYNWGPVWGPDYHGLAFSPDGKWMAGDNGKGQLAVWERATGKMRFTDDRSMFRFQGLAFSKDGDTLVSGAADMWDLKTGRSVVADEGHSQAIRAIDLTPDGNTIVSADGVTVRLWDAKTGVERRRLDAVGVSTLGLSFDGRTLVSNVFGSKSIHLWDMETGKQVRRIALEQDPAQVGFSPDARTIVTPTGHNLTVRFFDAETGKETRRLIGNRGTEFGTSPQPFRFSPDGRYFASLVRAKEFGVGIWDLSKAPASLITLDAPGQPLDLAFSPDGEYLAWSDMHHVHLWDMRAKKRLPTLEKVGRARLCFTPDGRYLVAGRKLHPMDPKLPPLELPVMPDHVVCSRDSNLLVVVPYYSCTLLVLDAKKLGK